MKGTNPKIDWKHFEAESSFYLNVINKWVWWQLKIEYIRTYNRGSNIMNKFDLPQVMWDLVFIIINFVYELPHDLSNNFLENIREVSKL